MFNWKDSQTSCTCSQKEIKKLRTRRLIRLFASHIHTLQNDSCLKAGFFDLVTLNGEQIAQLCDSRAHTLQTHKQETRGEEPLMKDSGQLLCSGELLGAALAARCSCCVLCMYKWIKQKLIEESLGSPSCWKGMPFSLGVLISHRRAR